MIALNKCFLSCARTILEVECFWACKLSFVPNYMNHLMCPLYRGAFDQFITVACNNYHDTICWLSHVYEVFCATMWMLSMLLLLCYYLVICSLWRWLFTSLKLKLTQLLWISFWISYIQLLTSRPARLAWSTIYSVIFNE